MNRTEPDFPITRLKRDQKVPFMAATFHSGECACGAVHLQVTLPSLSETHQTNCVAPISVVQLVLQVLLVPYY